MEYGGDGGRGDIGLWNERKEWKESTLDAMLAVSMSCLVVLDNGSVEFDGGDICSVSWGGAVTERPPLSPLGLVGVLRSSNGSAMSSEFDIIGVIGPGLSSWAFLSMTCSPTSFKPDPVFSCPMSFSNDNSASGRGRVLGVHGRLCVGVLGDSGNSTVKPLLKGHSVRSY